MDRCRTKSDHASVAPARPSVRVLVIDDTPCFREAAIELLHLRGYDVVGWVGSGAEALDAAERLDPDAVLLDVGLPDIDGFALAAELKRTHADLAVLVVSADQPHRLPCDSGVPFALKCDLINVDFGL